MRKKSIELQRKIAELLLERKTMQEVANELGLKSRQLVSYHFRQYMAGKKGRKIKL